MKDSETWERFAAAVHQQDTHKKLKAAEEIISFVQDPENTLDLSGVDKLVDGLTSWANSSNFRISQYALEILGALAERLGSSFKGFLTIVTPVIADRLGDSKLQVRTQAHNVLMKLMDPVSSPQAVFDLLTVKFNHKNWRVKEELMLFMIKTIETFGASSLQITRQMPAICKLLSDPTSQVREAAMNTIVVVYRHVGEKVRVDLNRRGIPAARLAATFAKFDECLNSGTMVVDTKCQESPKLNGDVEKPKQAKGSVRRSTSFTSPKRVSVMDRGSGGSSASSSGAIDECDFVSQWEEHVDIRVYSNREITEELNKINATLSDANKDWEQRVGALKRLRGLVKQFGDYDQVPKLLREFEESLKISVKDLRSQITKEVCVTLSYFSSRYGRDFDYLAEAVIPALLTLIANSVKVMASSGNAAIRLIIKHTHNPRLIPSFVSNLLTNRSKEIRRKCAEYIDLILESWETSNIKGHVSLIEEAVRKGIADADSEARAAMRRAYWHFADHYKARADKLMETFDATKQKLLQSDKNLLQAGVSRPASSLKGYKSTKSKKSVRSSSASSAADVEDRAMMPPPRKPATRAEPVRLPAGMQRSASQLEGKLVRTPKMEPRQKSCDEFFRSASGGTRTRQGKKPVASQPSSRSASPTRRMPSFSRERSEDYMKRVSPMKTRIPTPRKSSTSQSTSRSSSRAGSRDSSPVRMNRGGGNAVPVADLRNRYNGAHGNSKYVTEDELWNAYERSPGHRRFDSMNNNMHNNHHHSSDEESEGSSISSERSNSAYNLKQGPVTQDVNEIIRLLGNQSWTDNRDGMTSLQVYLQGNKKLSLEETLRIRDVCNKFFSDPHIKVYRIFLDVLSEFIIHCRIHLNDWIFILLTRLLHKIGSDILPSLLSKVARVLDIVRDSFPYDQQFQILTKYITDSTQTPTLKMKIAILHYLQGLIKLMDSSDFGNTGATRLAVSRIITWTSEPKSAEVRKEAAAVIVALFELNTPVFSTMLAVLPNSFQDGATKLLHSHLRPLANRVPQSPKPVPEYNAEYEEYSSKYASPMTKGQTRLGYRSISPTKHHSAIPHYDTTDSPSNYRPGHDESPPYHERLSGGRPDVRDGAEAGDVPNYLKTSSVMSKLNFSGDSMEDSPEMRGFQPRSQDNEIEAQRRIGKSGKGYQMTPTNHKTLNDSSFLSDVSPPHYDPKQYEDVTTKADDKTMLSPEMVRVADGAEEPDHPIEPPSPANLDMMNQITAVLSAPRNESGSEDLKSALIELIKLARTGAKENIPKIKNLMPIVTEILKHSEGAIRCLAARAIREVIRSLPEAYKSDIKHIVLGLIETQADSLKEVSKTAEECCNLIAENESASDAMKLMCPIIETVHFPSILAAIKMLNVVIERAQAALVMNDLDIAVSALLKGYDHSESTVRKASVFCLVSLHNLVGQDALTPYLEVLNSSKLKLLNLYIKRSQAAQ